MFKDSDQATEDNAYYICCTCSKRIHRGWIERSNLKEGGDVICCGAAMSPPGAAAMKISELGGCIVVVVLVGGSFVLCHYYDWSVWAAIPAALVVGSALAVPFMTDLRQSRKKG
jgi:hypothetical protein